MRPYQSYQLISDTSVVLTVANERWSEYKVQCGPGTGTNWEYLVLLIISNGPKI